ncbi:MAG: RHS repeat-associated core domain-containing protein [Verrucomicrobia bacterium]|nr:RHS repeat-associated core domain-containing protein [Verrucomicrobiota bacterium]
MALVWKGIRLELGSASQRAFGADLALNVPNSTAQYPTVTVVSQYGGAQTESGKVFVPPATESFTHDADGNLTQDGRWDLVWDGENRLVKLRSRVGSPAPERRIEFEYDHQGRRIRQTVFNDRDDGQGSELSDTIFLYDGWNLVAELNANSSNAKVRTYVWGMGLSGTMQGAGGVGGLLKVTYHGASTTNAFVAYDGNGNVTALIDASNGSICAGYEYGSFAEPIRVSGPISKLNPVRFSSKYTDDESGFLCYGYRYYNPGTGRWPSRDLIGKNGGLNLYSFALNSSPTWFDSDGRVVPLVLLGCAVVVEAGVLVHKCSPMLDGPGPLMPLVHSVPDCMIQIFVAHGYLGSAFDDDRKLKNPIGGAKLNHPLVVKGTRCSSGTVIACNAAKYTKIEDGLLDYEVPDTDLNKRQTGDKIADALIKARVHARILCRNCCMCKSIGIYVIYGDWSMGASSVFKTAWPFFGHSESVSCR